MPLATAEITYNLANLVGIPHHAGTSVTASTNIPRETVVDTDGNAIRLGSGKGSIDVTGTGKIDVWVPGEGSNPASWQTYIHVRYRDPLANKGHETRTFGPFTITASANLADLIDEQEVPPTYITALTAELDGYTTAAANSAAVAQSAADLATAVSGADTADDLITALDATPSSDFRVAQDARQASAIAAGVAGRTEVKEGALSPYRYGFVGDGTTNDQPALQAFLDALESGGLNSRGYIPKRPVRLNSQLNINAPTRVESDADFTVAPSHTGRFMLITNTDDVEFISRGWIDMNKAATTNGGNNVNQQGIYATYTDGVAHSGLKVTAKIKNSHQRGFVVSAVTGGGSISDMVLDLDVRDVGETAIQIAAAGNADKKSASASRNIALRAKVLNCGLNGIMASGISHIVLDRPEVRGGSATGQGITLGTTGTSLQTTDAAILHPYVNGFTGATKWGIVFTVNFTRGLLLGGTVEGCGGGVTVDPEEGGVAALVEVDLDIRGTVVRNSSALHGLNARWCRGLSVAGIKARGNYLAGIQVASALGVIVDDVHAIGNGSHGLAFNGSTAGTGAHRLGAYYTSGNNTRAVGASNLYIDPALPTAVRTATLADAVTA